MEIATDCLKIKAITAFVEGMEDARAQLRKEAEAGDLFSGLQADVLDPVIQNLRSIMSGTYVV